jgi:hypothetical protein
LFDGEGKLLTNSSCFVAGTPLVIDFEGNAIRIEQVRVGDWLLSRSENDPNGPLALKQVLAVFLRVGRILHLHVRERVIRTTTEHPFWVVNRGEWLSASRLEIGDVVVGYDGQCSTVEDLLDTGAYETVYNVRVAGYHTYFVGGKEWGFSVWAHNAEYKVEAVDGVLTLFTKNKNDAWEIVNWDPRTGKTGPRTFASKAEAEGALKDLNRPVQGTLFQDGPSGRPTKVAPPGTEPLPLPGSQDPFTAWAAKTGRAYDRRFREFWRQFEGQTLGDGWRVESVNRRLADGVQPDLVLVNQKDQVIHVYDLTSQEDAAHLTKGENYVKFFKEKNPGFKVEYSEIYWSGLENRLEAKTSSGVKYFPGSTKP